MAAVSFRRARKARPLLFGAAALLLVLLALIGAAFGLQRPLMYPRPPRPAAAPPLPAGAEQAWLGPAHEIEAWLLRPATASPPFPLIIYTHGNGELIDHWLEPFTQITAAGIGVLLVEYPGYGRSGGRPSQQSITAAIIAAYDFARRRPDVDAGRIVAYGRSLGGAAACALVSHRPLAALVLESTFTGTADLMPRFLPRRWVLDPFDSLSVVAAGGVPTLVLHGAHDRIIPYAHGEALARAAGTAPVPMPCGHNDCPRPWPAVLRFLRQQGIID